ncbi:TPA: cytochrome c, partial [Candidatus Poribacteria bacterium]|nr:cytochrome c [Candidatus Poribacteria bacterium]
MQNRNNHFKILKWQPKLATIFAIFSLAFYLLIAFGCAKKEDNLQKDSDVVMDTFTIREGERLYNKYCVPCHGAEGQGDGVYFTT